MFWHHSGKCCVRFGHAAINLDDAYEDENTRASYPLTSIPNIVPSGHAGHPQNIIMLTADAFGVLPPVARLSSAQAMYHFLSGYTAKVAGTGKGSQRAGSNLLNLLRRPFRSSTRECMQTCG